jgi:hypothetical protein
MISFIPPRLRKPLGYVLAGAIFAAAWLIHGGRLWWVAILVMVTALARATATYVRGGQDTDEGELAGSRADERLRELTMRSRAMAASAAAVAAFLGLTVAVAVWASWWWPFAVILVVLLFGYLFGWSTYGIGQSDPAEENAAGDTGTAAGHDAASAVNW